MAATAGERSERSKIELLRLIYEDIDAGNIVRVITTINRIIRTNTNRRGNAINGYIENIQDIDAEDIITAVLNYMRFNYEKFNPAVKDAVDAFYEFHGHISLRDESTEAIYEKNQGLRTELISKIKDGETDMNIANFAILKGIPQEIVSEESERYSRNAEETKAAATRAELATAIEEAETKKMVEEARTAAAEAAAEAAAPQADPSVAYSALNGILMNINSGKTNINRIRDYAGRMPSIKEFLPPVRNRSRGWFGDKEPKSAYAKTFRAYLINQQANLAPLLQIHEQRKRGIRARLRNPYAEAVMRLAGVDKPSPKDVFNAFSTWKNRISISGKKPPKVNDALWTAINKVRAPGVFGVSRDYVSNMRKLVDNYMTDKTVYRQATVASPVPAPAPANPSTPAPTKVAPGGNSYMRPKQVPPLSSPSPISASISVGSVASKTPPPDRRNSWAVRGYTRRAAPVPKQAAAPESAPIRNPPEEIPGVPVILTAEEYSRRQAAGLAGGARRTRKTAASRRMARTHSRRQRGGATPMPLAYYQPGAYETRVLEPTGAGIAASSDSWVRAPVTQTGGRWTRRGQRQAGGFSPSVMGQFASAGLRLLPVAGYMGYKMFSKKSRKASRKAGRRTRRR